MSCFNPLLLLHIQKKTCFMTKCVVQLLCPMLFVLTRIVRYHVLHFLGTLGVTITRDTGVLTAGQLYNLTCTVTLDGVTGSPTIKWLDPNDNPLLNSTSVTVENMVMVNGSAYNRTLVFSSVHTSHGGQYTCQTTLDQVSTMASTNISVQSAYVKAMSFYVHSS